VRGDLRPDATLLRLLIVLASFFVFATILALEPRLLRDVADTESHRMLNEAGDDYNNF